MYFSTATLIFLLPTAFAQLNTLAKAKGLKYFGSATDNPELTDASYVAILSNTSEFGQITPGNSQKWDAIEPSQNTFTYSGGDAIVSLAQNNGQLVRCHNLCWYSQLPGWVTSDSWTNATLIAALKNHIVNEVTHYKGKCYAWDVVNEAFNDDGTYRTDVFYNTIGPEYIPIAFETAAATDPNVKLYYNDYNIEYSGPKATAALNLVKSLKARGIKIDGVGLQGHFIVGETPNLAAQTANLDSFTALGVEVAYTELDIRYTSLPPTSSGLIQQATDYYNTVCACLSTTGGNGCVGVTLWDYTDKYSWIPSTFQGQGDACPWDTNLVKKPTIYGAIVSALQSCGTGAPSSSTVMPTTMHTVTVGSTMTTPPPVSTTSTPAGACPTSTSVSTTYITVTSTEYVPGSSATSTPAGPSSTAVSTGGTAAHWGQCGGNGWTGPTVCASPYTCTYNNQWYSQCL